MTDRKEIPELTSELIDMSRDYLRQETIEPAKKLGKHAGLGIGGAIVLAIGAICLTWGFYYGLTLLFERTAGESRWWIVLSRLLTTLAAVGAAGIVAWRMSLETESEEADTESEE